VPASDVDWLNAIGRISGAAAVLLDGEGRPAAADEAALRLLGCDSIEALRNAWPENARGSADEVAFGGPDARAFLARILSLGDGAGLKLALVRKAPGNGEKAPEKGAETLAFARKLGHDLRGPLNAMVLNLDLLRTYLDMDVDEAERNAKLRRYMAALNREIGRLNELLTSALDRARA